MISYDVLTISCGVASLFVLRLFYQVVHHLYFHPLSRFPGPKIAAITGLYQSYFETLRQPGGQYMFEIDRLHRIYGPIVRICPNEVHIDDIDFSDTLYALGEKRDKDINHTQIFGTPLSLFGSEKHDVHRGRRSAINPFFSKASIQRLEPVIIQRVQQMCDMFSEAGHRNETVNLRNAFVAVVIDIVTAHSFAKSAGALEKDDFSPNWESMMSGVTEAVPLARSIPGIVQFMQILPLALIRKLDPLVGAFFDYSKLIRVQVSNILRQNASSTAKFSSEKPTQMTVFHDLLSSSLPAHEKSEDRLTQEGVGLVSAAAETTSIALFTTMFHILQSPSLVSRLREEMSGLDTSAGPAEWRQLEKLELLNATVKEGLRVATAICGRLPLIADTSLRYKEWVIPAKTTISMSPRDCLLSPQIFPSPKTFDPDRWIRAAEPGNEEMRARMNKAYVPFNKGPRMCLGFNLAYADMYHIIWALLRRFDLRVVDTIHSRDVECVRDHFVAKSVRGSRGVSVKVVGEFS